MKKLKNYNLRFLAVTLIVLFITACSSDEFTPKNSIAEFSVELNDLEVSFTSNSKYAVSLSWDFGDGETSTDINPTHTYSEAGDYTVTLTTVAANGAESGVSSNTVSVALINPTAVFTSVVDDKTVTFTNTSERAVSYSWDFGDSSDISTEENPVHIYAEDGDYTVTLTTTGIDGSTPATGTETVSIGQNSGGGIITIAVENADFQLPATDKLTNWGNVPGWNSDTQAADSGVEEDSENAGEWFGFRMSGDPAVYNLTEHVIVGNEEFKVNLEAWDGWNSSQIIVSLYYDTGDGVRTTLASQTFEFGSIELTASATPASVGAKIGIMIEDNLVTDVEESDTGWAKFDKVELSAEVAQVAVFEEVTVENADFQLPATDKQSNWENVPGWNSDTQAADSGVEEDSENAGEWYAFRMSGDPAVYNLTNHVIADGEEFKLNLEAWDGWNSSQIIVGLYYATEDGVRTTLASQTFEFGSIELIATATPASVGAKIGIMIENNLVTDVEESDTGWAKFDKVQLFSK